MYDILVGILLFVPGLTRRIETIREMLSPRTDCDICFVDLNSTHIPHSKLYFRCPLLTYWLSVVATTDSKSYTWMWNVSQSYFTQVQKQILNCLKMAVSATYAYVISQRLAAYMTTYIYFQDILLLSSLPFL